ncbi:MAG: DeoR/GlpR family DNA-binding transcription regulator [Flavobacterium sp.]|nr:DeoR/GlpR family DNA-binding transcription regulator [Flavobacterium sp.]
MLKTERQAFILRQINLHNRVLSSDLSSEINVSEDTIRRDLNELSELGKIIKVHGGALSKSFHSSFLRKDVYKSDNKKIIASKAVALITDGMFILTSGGTTVIELARLLPEHLHATFFTGSIPAAYEYAQHPNIEVIFIGDKISKSSQIAVGGEAISKINSIKPDLCFLGVNAIDKNGISDNDWEVVQIKKAMIKAAKRTVVLSISDKIDTHQSIKICGLDEVDTLITELDASDILLENYNKLNISIL